MRLLEQRLKDLGFYPDPVSGAYGLTLAAAVDAFQKSKGLLADGVVGPSTWVLLFPAEQTSAQLAERCLALTGSFETSAGIPDCFGGLAGDFDGMGLSFGALQWNLGQGTLQPLFSDMLARHEEVFAGIFLARLDALKATLALPREGQLAWARSIQDLARHVVAEPWKGLFQALGRTPECQDVQSSHAERYLRDAEMLCAQFGLRTERGLALMFDVCVQNGGVDAAVEARITADCAAIPAGTAALDAELWKLRSIANRRAEASSARFVEDVRTRKLTIANGTGCVHGVRYDLEGLGIRLVERG